MKSSGSTRRIKRREIVKRKIEEIKRRMSRSAKKEIVKTENLRNKRGKSELVKREIRRTRRRPGKPISAISKRILTSISVGIRMSNATITPEMKTKTIMVIMAPKMISWANDAIKSPTIQALTIPSLRVQITTAITTQMRSRPSSLTK